MEEAGREDSGTFLSASTPGTSAAPPPLGVDELPALAEAASDASLAAQRWHVRGTAAQLALLVVGAVFGAVRLRLEPGGSDWAAWGCLVSFGGATIVTGYLYAQRPDRVWYDGRAAAESVKTLAWRYAVGGDPFPLTASPAEADQLFVSRLTEVVESLEYVSVRSSASGAQITDSMRRCRAAALPDRTTAYERGRIDDQQEWYRTKGRWNERRARVLGGATLALEVVGLGAAVIRAAGIVDVDLLGVVAALAAALTAWSQMKQHDALARAYAVASHELAAIRALIVWQDTEAGWASFVDQAEEAISREHTLWRASRGIAKYGHVLRDRVPPGSS